MENVKIVLIGPPNAGKTTYLLCKHSRSFVSGYIPTVSDNFSFRLNESIDISFWDTAGANDYDRLRPLSYPGTNLFVVMFDIVDPGSFDVAIKKFLNEIMVHSPDTPFVIVGNKCDTITNKRPLSYLEARQQALDSGALNYFEISNKTKEGLQRFNTFIEGYCKAICSM